jgi:hypothetical protein
LGTLGCGDLDPATISKLDSVENMDDLERVGRAVANKVEIDDFGPFLTP